MEDEKQWTNGQYTFSALMAALDKAFNGHKAVCEYPDKPMYSSALSTEQEKQRSEEIENRKALEQFEAEQFALRQNFLRYKKQKAKEQGNIQ